jgi:hypothetical protein
MNLVQELALFCHSVMANNSHHLTPVSFVSGTFTKKMVISNVCFQYGTPCYKFSCPSKPNPLALTLPNLTWCLVASACILWPAQPRYPRFSSEMCGPGALTSPPRCAARAPMLLLRGAWPGPFLRGADSLSTRASPPRSGAKIAAAASALTDAAWTAPLLRGVCV